MKKINILHIITNLELGGAQRHVLSLINNLDNAKYNIHIISAPQGALLDEARSLSNAHVCLLPMLKRQISPINDLKSLIFIRQYIKRHNIHIVHTHSSKAGIIGRWAGQISGAQAILHTVHGWSFNDYQCWLLKWMYVLLEMVTARITTAFIAVSHNDINKGMRYKIGNKKQYHLIHYGVKVNTDISLDEQTSLRQEFGIGPGCECITMIACLKPQKNPQDFIRLANNLKASYPKAIFLSIGDGILRDSLQKQINQDNLQAQVRLCGWRRDIEGILSISDIIVLTSLWEGMPIALLEAMAFAKPIAAYASDGVKEMISDGVNGFLAEPQDISSLSEKIDSLLHNSDQRHEMGLKAREFFNNPSFTVSHMLQKTQQLYDECLEGTGCFKGK